jgi:hypothetical protein
MPNKVAKVFGRLGGLATSEAKAKAARRNAKKGGWPKGKKRGAPPAPRGTPDPTR